MSKESYFLEAYIKGNELPSLRPEVSDDPQKEKHLHITFIRPFDIKSDQEEIKNKIVEYCQNKSPISFILEGKKDFDGKIFYIPVKSDELQHFDNELEKILENNVTFSEKLNEQKILHLTIESDIQPISKTEMAMLRLTCIHNKKIWFSYDFVTQEVLDRQESLDPDRWQKTQEIFKSLL